jgi:hypothetical protein
VVEKLCKLESKTVLAKMNSDEGTAIKGQKKGLHL